VPLRRVRGWDGWRDIWACPCCRAVVLSEEGVAPYLHDRHRADDRVHTCCWRCAMSGADPIIRWSTAFTVLGVAAVAAVASYEHAYDLVRAHVSLGGLPAWSRSR